MRKHDWEVIEEIKRIKEWQERFSVGLVAIAMGSVAIATGDFWGRLVGVVLIGVGLIPIAISLWGKC